MTLAFVILAAAMLIAALALVLRPLLRQRAADSDPAAALHRRMQALKTARAAGVLDDEEFAAKRAELKRSSIPAATAAPARSRPAFAAAATIALLLPALAIVLYRLVGEPRALDPAVVATAPAASATPDHGADMDQAIAGLAAKLKQTPDDAEGWALLGRAYLETQHFSEARDALKHAHDLVPDEPDVAVAYAEALTLASDTHRIDGEARTLLETALKANPKNERGVWLTGMAEYQDGRYDAAIARWNELLTILAPDSTARQAVSAQIARAEAARDGREPPADADAAAERAVAAQAPAPTADSRAAAVQSAPAAPTTAPAATAGAKLTVRVALDPKLGGKVAPNDTLFVYAKASNGPPMPLAIQRLHAADLPATVVLTDGMGMLPNMKLSQFPQVTIGARISKSGNAIAQSGDLQTLSKPLDVATTAPISLTIDQTVP